MSKITSPLQALEAIRDTCQSGLHSRTYEMLRREVDDLAHLGIANAVPLPAPRQVFVRDLQPADVLAEVDGLRMVVLAVRLVAFGPTYDVMLARLGNFPERGTGAESEIAFYSWHGDSKMEVARPALAAAQVQPPAPTRKAARNLVPGDVCRTTDGRAVVLYARDIAGGRVELTLGMLGEFGAANEILTHAPDSQFTVEAPAGLTPVQAAADKLLGYALAYRDCAINDKVPSMTSYEGEALCVLLDELDPPKPPTLDETIKVLRKLEAAQWIGSGALTTVFNEIRKLLARVPN